MTREEAKSYLENYRNMYADLAPERFLEALDCILSQPSIPSDLDKAAEKIVIQLHPCMEYSSVLGDRLTNGELVELVNAGAESQKEQMMKEAVEGEVCGRVYDHINIRFADGVCKFLEPKNISHIPADVSKYKVGDKVRLIVLKAKEESK